MYDLIVIGSGPAGEKGAAQAAYFGKRVALIEREPVLGGACVNTGTVPSKTLRESALQLSGFRMRAFGDAIGLTIKDNITVADLMRRKQIVVEREWQRIDANLRRHLVDRYSGNARFLSPTKIEITNALGTEAIEGTIILIATGSSPYRASNVPFDDEFICDSDSILGIDTIPKTLAVVGAGVIGCEYASIFAALGVEVHLIDGRTSLLPQIDREIMRILIADMQQRLGVVMHLGSDVEEIDRCEHEVALTLKDGREIVCDKVLYAAGRSSNTADLNLDAAGVKTGNRGLVVVDENYRTNVPNIYAAGDVIGFPALASTSMEQARVAMVHAFDLKYKTRVAPILPYAIYTIPELATVGLTEDECRKKGINPATGRAAYRNNARGQIIGDTKGMIKIVFDRESLAILGVHIVGESASELLHTGMMAMQFGGTINAFIDCVFNFPTLGEAYKYAAYDGLGSLALKPKETVA
ncbi:MAG TPA: Si-specific NAD(P)(+) transhydrogenase [Thermoanaerobaculia bacterium]|jgi:NAD(P) transhydrogenase|nr:Si-specific NAD(P)(+) transhydrogenase [Thermoanaerobaculia bacterium]